MLTDGVSASSEAQLKQGQRVALAVTVAMTMSRPVAEEIRPRTIAINSGGLRVTFEEHPEPPPAYSQAATPEGSQQSTQQPVAPKARAGQGMRAAAAELLRQATASPWVSMGEPCPQWSNASGSANDPPTAPLVQQPTSTSQPQPPRQPTASPTTQSPTAERLVVARNPGFYCVTRCELKPELCGLHFCLWQNLERQLPGPVLACAVWAR